MRVASVVVACQGRGPEVTVNQSHVLVNAGFGFDEGAGFWLIHTHAPMPEWGHVANHISLFAHTGLAYTMATGVGGTAGFVLGGGSEYAFSPDWSARATLGYRQGFSSVEKDFIKAGTLSALRLGASLGYVF